MNNQEVEQIIREYIEQVIHMSLATTAGDKPWVCEVHCAYDADLNLYFRSLPTTRHCTELQQNAQVAGNIVTQHFKNQKPRGVYFEGTAEMVEDADEQHPAYVATAARFGDKAAAAALPGSGGELRYYKVTVTDWYLFDTYVSNPAQKYHLPWKA